jgi:hypothetical protein
MPNPAGVQVGHVQMRFATRDCSAHAGDAPLMDSKQADATQLPLCVTGSSQTVSQEAKDSAEVPSDGGCVTK